MTYALSEIQNVIVQCYVRVKQRGQLLKRPLKTKIYRKTKYLLYSIN